MKVPGPHSGLGQTCLQGWGGQQLEAQNADTHHLAWALVC